MKYFVVVCCFVVFCCLALVISALRACSGVEQREMHRSKIGWTTFRTYETRGSTFSEYPFIAIDRSRFLFWTTVLCVPDVDSLSIVSLGKDSVRVDIYLYWQQYDPNSAPMSPWGERAPTFVGDLDKVGEPGYRVIKSISARLSDFDTVPDPYWVKDASMIDSTGKAVPLDSLDGYQASDRFFRH